jgi:hypothetical protein
MNTSFGNIGRQGTIGSWEPSTGWQGDQTRQTAPLDSEAAEIKG